MSFLKENWAWIVVPFVVTLLAIGAFVWFSAPSDGGENPFVYNVF